jgi:hypothetical protein
MVIVRKSIDALKETRLMATQVMGLAICITGNTWKQQNTNEHFTV